MKSMFLNVILLVFPILCHFLYMIYSKTMLKDENYLFFDLMLLSSLYFFIRFGDISKEYAVLILFILFLSMFKRRYIVGFLLIIYLSFFLSKLYVFNFFICAFFLLMILIFSYYRKVDIKLLFIITSCFIFEIIILSNSMIEMLVIIKIFISFVISFILFVISCKIYSKLESMINLLLSLDDILKEKKLYESLFKITHEIKNPLAVCKGYLDMFDAKDEAKTSRYVGIINQEIDRTLLLLNDFSDISKMKVEKRNMDITLLCEDVCDEVSLIFNKNIKFEFNIPDEEVFINGDYNRLKQVLLNVIKNSKEAIKNEGMVTFNAEKRNNNYCIEIKDNGIGMDNETINKIGSAFYTTKKNGTGLGVCLSKEIIDKHKGIINYISKINKGTTCIIKIPTIKVS